MKNKRDFSAEYRARKAKQKRVYADIDRAKAEALALHLAAKGQTLAAWLNKHIDEAIGL